MATGKKRAATKAKPNRLADETSTYLLQHAYNPVDWYPWGSEALERAARENKPILLSIGYAACHWCHVMEHESFEDEETAKLMNDNFVNIKVDREERTDLDEIYMKAVQLMTGHGGWPMTVFLTPALKPFYGGTYFPKEDRHGLPSFKRLLLGIMQAWNEQRHDIDASAEEVTSHLLEMNGMISSIKPSAAIDRQVIEDAGRRFLAIFDRRWGGFGNAPKFPHTFSIDVVMRLLCHHDLKESDREEYQNLIETTLDKMAFGGIQDHLGGGFARYSVDREWLVPHFEKMLYDNALLSRTYLDAYRLLGKSYYADVARGILDFVADELRCDKGGFYSSLDADSEGEEGKFYVFTIKEIKSALGKDADWFASVMGASERGNFEHGTNVLHLSQAPSDSAGQQNMSEDEFTARLSKLKEKLLAVRAKRVRPGRDEKVLTSWNSLMISAFAEGYKVLHDEKYLRIATEAGRFVLGNLIKEGRLLRTWGQGKAKLNAYLDDYGCFIQALLDLASIDFDQVWLKEADRLAELMVKLFYDEESRDFYYTSNDHETLVLRPSSHYDGSVPSGTSSALLALLKLSRVFDRRDYEEIAETVMLRFAPLVGKAPDQFSNLLCAIDLHLAEPVEIVVVASPETDARALIFAASEAYIPNKVMVVSRPDSKGAGPLVENRETVAGKPAAYVCRNFACESAVTDGAALKKALAKAI